MTNRPLNFCFDSSAQFLPVAHGYPCHRVHSYHPKVNADHLVNGTDKTTTTSS